MTNADVDRQAVAAAVRRVLRQRFPVREHDDDPVVRVPLSRGALDRIADDIAAAVDVDPTAFTVGLDLDVLISACQELVAVITATRADDDTSRWIRPLVDAALEAGELLADLGRPVTNDVRLAMVP